MLELLESYDKILLASSKLQPCLPKQPLNTQKKLKESELIATASKWGYIIQLNEIWIN